MDARTWTAKLRDDQGASALIVIVIVALGLLAMAGVVMNVGMLYAEKRSMQTAADAGALAGVQQLPTDPTNPSALTWASTYALKNATADQTSRWTVTPTLPAAYTVKVAIRDPAYPLVLSQFIGMNSALVAASATAMVSSPSSYKAVMPFGLMASTASATAAFGYNFNQQYKLKVGSGGSADGNFGLLDLGTGNGTSALKSAINGGGLPASIGQTVGTAPGNKPPVIDALDSYVNGSPDTPSSVYQLQPDGTITILDYTNKHLLIVPIIYDPGPPPVYGWDAVNGRSSVKILTFAWVWVDSASKGSQEIVCTFVRPLNPDEVAAWGTPNPGGVPTAIVYHLTN